MQGPATSVRVVGIRLHLLRIPDAFLRTGQRKYLCIVSECLRTLHDSLTGQLHLFKETLSQRG